MSDANKPTLSKEAEKLDGYDFLSRYENMLVQCGLVVSDEHLDYDKLAEVRKRFVEELAQIEQSAIKAERERIIEKIEKMTTNDRKTYLFKEDVLALAESTE